VSPEEALEQTLTEARSLVDGALHDLGIRAYADNCILLMDPPPAQTASGLAIVHNRSPGAREHRTARVLASGPGYHKPCCGGFVPNTVKAGDRVIVDAMAGQIYALDLNTPRHNKSSVFQELLGERGEFRCVREEEILGIIENDVDVAAE
jgi:co-chaperonin GroES (HSP10)